ncbi:hypothetical protein Nepgr_030841 [Nepenthes gracilis]|uniref:Uncharacterized protein n=1 Tax=Nepenthes gracilis TaxID=150966 RepID=A0AAD3TFI0_NEPGR|nr:hypothetical protein Nepgr_030841 [Nepenthes gracilis]
MIGMRTADLAFWSFIVEEILDWLVGLIAAYYWNALSFFDADHRIGGFCCYPALYALHDAHLASCSGAGLLSGYYCYPTLFALLDACLASCCVAELPSFWFWMRCSTKCLPYWPTLLLGGFPGFASLVGLLLGSLFVRCFPVWLADPTSVVEWFPELKGYLHSGRVG